MYHYLHRYWYGKIEMKRRSQLAKSERNETEGCKADKNLKLMSLCKRTLGLQIKIFFINRGRCYKNNFDINRNKIIDFMKEGATSEQNEKCQLNDTLLVKT